MGTALYYRALPKNLWPEFPPERLLSPSDLIWVAEGLIGSDRGQSALVAAAEAIRKRELWLEFDLRSSGLAGAAYMLPSHLQLPWAGLRLGFEKLIESGLAVGKIDVGCVRLAPETIKELIQR